jgi:hypothetical protein
MQTIVTEQIHASARQTTFGMGLIALARCNPDFFYLYQTQRSPLRCLCHWQYIMELMRRGYARDSTVQCIQGAMKLLGLFGLWLLLYQRLFMDWTKMLNKLLRS